MSIQKIIARQTAYYVTDANEWKKSKYFTNFSNLKQLLNLGLPKHKRYAI